MLPAVAPAAAPRPVKLADAIQEHSAKGTGDEASDAGRAAARSDIGSLRSVRAEVYRSAEPDQAQRGTADSKVLRSAPREDLKRIRGIGVLIENRLNAMGVVAYEQIANWTAADIDRVSQSLDFKGRIERENWVEQARILASGGATEFSRRVDRGEMDRPLPAASVSARRRESDATGVSGEESCVGAGQRDHDDMMSRRTKNILFIMCDQLRWDYLSCYGHPRLATPNIDSAGGQGRAFHARLRAVARVRLLAHELLHGALRAVARRHVERRAPQGRRDDARRLPAPARGRLRAGRQDAHARRPEGMERLGIDPNSIIGVRVAECGFDPYERDDGLHGVGPDGRYDPAKCPATTAGSTTRAMPATTPGTTGPTRRRARATGSRPAGPCATPGSPRASPRRTPRRPT